MGTGICAGSEARARGTKWAEMDKDDFAFTRQDTSHNRSYSARSVQADTIEGESGDDSEFRRGILKAVSRIDRHRDYANSTGDSHLIVRTFNSLAEAARLRDPDWAIARVEEALAWDRNEVRNWTVLARCLWARGLKADKAGDAAGAERDGLDAMDTLWDARFRFPWEPVVRNELGKLYRDAGNLDTAETVYRESIADFPQNVVCRKRLRAEVPREKRTH